MLRKMLSAVPARHKISKEELTEQFVVSLVVSFIGNDQLSAYDLANPVLAQQYRDGKPFTLLGSGSLSPFLAFAGISKETQKNIASGSTNHRVILIDYFPAVKDMLAQWKIVAAVSKNFDQFELFAANSLKSSVTMKSDSGKNAFAFTDEHMNELLTLLNIRIRLLKDIFNSKDHGYKAFCTLMERAVFECADWAERERFYSAISKHKDETSPKDLVIYGSNLTESLARLIHDPVIGNPAELQQALKYKQLGDPLAILADLKPSCIIYCSEQYLKLYYKKREAYTFALHYDPKKPENLLDELTEFFGREGVITFLAIQNSHHLRPRPASALPKGLRKTFIDDIIPVDFITTLLNRTALQKLHGYFHEYKNEEAAEMLLAIQKNMGGLFTDRTQESLRLHAPQAFLPAQSAARKPSSAEPARTDSPSKKEADIKKATKRSLRM